METKTEIVVLDRGFVMVGHTTISGEFMYIDNAQTIRRWGTSKGLGELINGPLPDTQLDYTGTVRAPMRAVIFTIAVNDYKWKSTLV